MEHRGNSKGQRWNFHFCRLKSTVKTVYSNLGAIIAFGTILNSCVSWDPLCSWVAGPVSFFPFVSHSPPCSNQVSLPLPSWDDSWDHCTHSIAVCELTVEAQNRGAGEVTTWGICRGETEMIWRFEPASVTVQTQGTLKWKWTAFLKARLRYLCKLRNWVKIICFHEPHDDPHVWFPQFIPKRKYWKTIH